MASYVVMRPASGGDADIRTVLVRDGFSLWAFLIPFFWFLWQRLWIEAILVLAASFALAALGEAAGMGDWPVIGLGLLVNLLAGLEGNDRRIARLRRKGFEEVAVVSAPDLADAEARYFRHDPADEAVEPVEPPSGGPATPPSRAPLRGDALVGLVGHRGGM